MTKNLKLDELKQSIFGDMLGHIHEKDISKITRKIEEMQDDIIFAFIAKYGFDIDNPTIIEYRTKMNGSDFVTEIKIKTNNGIA